MIFEPDTTAPDRPAVPSIPAAYYKVTGRGFFSEFNVLAFAYAHCLAHGRTMFVDIAPRAGPWRDLFSQFPKPGRVLQSDPRFRTEVSLVPKGEDLTWNADWLEMRKQVRDACLEKRWVEVPLLGFEGPFDELVYIAARKLFRPEESLIERASAAKRATGLEKVPFAAVQLRRGDKVHGYRSPKGKWVVETGIASFAHYAECLGKLAPGVSDVFVLTDDYEAFLEARSEFPEYRFHTLCEPHERGYRHTEQQSASDDVKLANLRKLLVTVIIARESQAFVGTTFSNLSIGVYLLHHRRKRCASVDLARPWPERDPLFMPGRDEI